MKRHTHPHTYTPIHTHTHTLTSHTERDTHTHTHTHCDTQKIRWRDTLRDGYLNRFMHSWPIRLPLYLLAPLSLSLSPVLSLSFFLPFLPLYLSFHPSLSLSSSLFYFVPLSFPLSLLVALSLSSLPLPLSLFLFFIKILNSQLTLCLTHPGQLTERV